MAATKAPGRAKDRKVRPVRFLPVLHDLDVDMVRNATLNGRRVRVKLANSISAVEVEWTMDGASLLTVTVEDHDHRLLQDKVTDGRFDLQLDRGGGRWLIDREQGIGGISVQGAQTSLKLWDYPSAVLKQPGRSIRKPSDKMDLAGWVRLLAREVRDQVNFAVIVPRPGFIPEVTDRDADRAESVTHHKTRSATSSDGTPAWMTDPHAGKLTMVQVAQLALKVGLRGEDAVIAVSIVPGESSLDSGAHFYNPPTTDDSWGLWQINLWGSLKATRPPPSVLTTPLGNAKAMKAIYDGIGGNWFSTAGWHGEEVKHTQYMAQARQAVHAAMSGKTSVDRIAPRSGGSTVTESREVVKPSEWRRTHNTWRDLGALGNRIGRRRFVALPRAARPRLVFARDQDLIKARPHQQIGINDDLLTEAPSIDLDGHAKLKQVELTVITTGWIAPPGAAVELEDTFGPAAGNWLVQSVDVKTGELTAQVTLTKPTTEPHPVTVGGKGGSFGGLTVSGGRFVPGSRRAPGGDGVNAVYAKAIEISRQNLPYTWGGGHNTTFSGNPGYDCSGYVSACLHAAGWLSTPMATGGLLGWGAPGEGRAMTVWVNETGVANTSHTYITFVGRHYVRAGTLAQNCGPPGPHVRTCPRSSAGFVPRHWPGS